MCVCALLVLLLLLLLLVLLLVLLVLLLHETQSFPTLLTSIEVGNLGVDLAVYTGQHSVQVLGIVLEF